MSKSEIVKEYSNGELTVLWKPKKCIHSEICVKTLPDVYRPDEKPWIVPDRASTEALKSQIARCPSGALSYRMDDETQEVAASDAPKVKLQVLSKGPLLIQGPVTVMDVDGNEVTKEGSTAFCRCGGSKNKPYCDGSHRSNGFTD